MKLYIVRFSTVSKSYLKLEFAEGKNMDAPGQILVNETFLKMMSTQYLTAHFLSEILALRVYRFIQV